MDTKEITQTLKCILTDQERMLAGIKLAELGANLSALEGDKKRVVKDFDAKISAVEAEGSILGNTIRSGYEFREIKCTVTYSDPVPGKKRIVRNDDGTEVSVQFMTKDELQRDLEFEAKVKEEKDKQTSEALSPDFTA